MKARLSRDSAWRLYERDFPREGAAADRLRFLVRYAVLAPSSHNTQPWKFGVEGEDRVSLYLDRSRWLRVADSDLREMHISVGCALENLLVAAGRFGYDCDVLYLPDAAEPDLAARIRFKPRAGPSTFMPTALFDAITARHTSHKTFEPRPIPPEDLRLIEGRCAEEGVEIFLTADPEVKIAVDELVARADALQFSDPAFREELGLWIGRGVFGTPWLLAKVGQFAVTHINMAGPTARKDHELLMSAPVLGLICSAVDDRRSQIRVGQVFERVYLTCATLGLSLQPVSQILQVPETKSELTRVVPARGLFPQQPFRLGYAEPEEKHTPRRRLDEVLM